MNTALRSALVLGLTAGFVIGGPGLLEANASTLTNSSSSITYTINDPNCDPDLYVCPGVPQTTYPVKPPAPTPSDTVTPSTAPSAPGTNGGTIATTGDNARAFIIPLGVGGAIALLAGSSLLFFLLIRRRRA